MKKTYQQFERLGETAARHLLAENCIQPYSRKLALCSWLDEINKKQAREARRHRLGMAFIGATAAVLAAMLLGFAST